MGSDHSILHICSVDVTPPGPPTVPPFVLLLRRRRKKKKSWDYGLQLPNDAMFLLVIRFYFLRVSCVYISDEVPMFSKAGRVWGGRGTETFLTLLNQFCSVNYSYPNFKARCQGF